MRRPSSPTEERPSRERWALAGLWVLVLAPVVAHGIWRPVLEALGGAGDALAVSLAAVAVAGAVVGAAARWPARPRRWLLASLPVVAAGAAWAGGLAALAALVAVAGVAVGVQPRLAAAAPRLLDGRARHRRVTTGAVALAGALTLFQVARLATFMGDADRVEHATTAGLAPLLTHHACLTAYVQATRLASARVDDLYAEEWWPSQSAAGQAHEATYAPFHLDAYLYPPQFLLAPWVLQLAGSSFAAQRAAWFGFTGLFLAFCLWSVVIELGRRSPQAAARALLFMPVIWLAGPVMISVQVGNVHVAVMGAAVLGMLYLHRQRFPLGGALLAFAILAKISPAVLGVLLVVQRRWRAVAWTAGFGVIWSLAALALFGWAPFAAFLQGLLPRLGSGQAFAFFAERLRDVIINTSPFGVPFKLHALGVPIADPWVVAGHVGAAFNVVVVGLVVIGGLRARRLDGPGNPPGLDVGLWLALLTLGCLRSPFAPTYITFTAFWLLSVWIADARGRGAVVWTTLGVAVLLGVPPMPPAAALIVTLVQDLALLGLLAWYVIRGRRPA